MLLQIGPKSELVRFLGADSPHRMLRFRHRQRCAVEESEAAYPIRRTGSNVERGDPAQRKAEQHERFGGVPQDIRDGVRYCVAAVDPEHLRRQTGYMGPQRCQHGGKDPLVAQRSWKKHEGQGRRLMRLRGRHGVCMSHHARNVAHMDGWGQHPAVP